MANYNPNNLIDSNNSIPNQTVASVFRNSIEDKNLISEKNSIYIGTGETNTVTVGEDSYEVSKTEGLSGPTAANQNLMLNSNGDLTWRQTKLSEIEDDGAEIENATNATNVTTNINGQAISSIFESNGTTVKQATNATNTTNVTTNINGQAISSIFESDGTTVKQATNAQTASVLSPNISIFTGALDSGKDFWIVNLIQGERYNPDYYYLPLISFSNQLGAVWGGTIVHGTYAASFFPANLFASNVVAIEGFIHMSLQRKDDGGTSMMIIFSYMNTDEVAQTTAINARMGSLGGDYSISNAGDATLTLIRIA